MNSFNIHCKPGIEPQEGIRNCCSLCLRSPQPVGEADMIDKGHIVREVVRENFREEVKLEAFTSGKKRRYSMQSQRYMWTKNMAHSGNGR